jgi:hypothetical protein
MIHPWSLLQEGQPRTLTVLAPVVAMMNHDCAANALVCGLWDKTKSAVLARVSAVRDIKAGACGSAAVLTGGTHLQEATDPVAADEST